MTAKTTTERQREFRQRKAGTPEVRGIFAHPDDHADIKAHAAKIAKKRQRLTKAKPV